MARCWWRVLVSRDTPLLRYPWVMGDRFSLYVGRNYRLRQSVGPWPAGVTVRFTSTHAEPSDRTWDTYFDFELVDGDGAWSMGPADQPHTVGQSYLLFDDIREDVARDWENPAIMTALRHRATRIRELTADEINASTTGQSEILPELVAQAFSRGAVENSFLSALKRLGELACRAAETVLENCAQRPQAERLLSQLGSHRYFEEHLACLSDSDPMRVRYAMARLADIGDPAAVDSIRPLLEHPHLNVQLDARSVLARLELVNGEKQAE